MALHGEGEPQPTTLQVATQAATIELFRQWQTYRNGVHMDWDTFRSIDFQSLASAVLTTAKFTTLLDEHRFAPAVTVPVHLPGALTPDARRSYGLSAADVAAHAEQVQG